MVGTLKPMTDTFGANLSNVNEVTDFIRSKSWLSTLFDEKKFSHRSITIIPCCLLVVTVTLTCLTTK